MNKKFRREIEHKYVIQDDVSMYLAHNFLLTLLGYDVKVIEGVSTDTFWQAPYVDFIRLRANTKELTVKITDKGSIEDRLEENLEVPNLEDATRWATAIWGNPVGILEKAYYVYYAKDYVVSLYMVTGSPELYLEVESESLETVRNKSKEFAKQFTLVREHRSLYTIVFGGTDEAA